MEDMFIEYEVSDRDRVTKLGKYASPATEEEWSVLPAYKAGTFEDFKKEVIANYPEAINIANGSIASIVKICKPYQGRNRITPNEYEELLKFKRSFQAIAARVTTKPPSLVSNRELVDYFLGALSSRFADRVEEKLESMPPVQAGAAPASNRHKEDLYDIKDVISAAVSIAERTARKGRTTFLDSDDEDEDRSDRRHRRTEDKRDYYRDKDSYEDDRRDYRRDERRESRKEDRSRERRDPRGEREYTREPTPKEDVKVKTEEQEMSLALMADSLHASRKQTASDLEEIRRLLGELRTNQMSQSQVIGQLKNSISVQGNAPSYGSSNSYGGGYQRPSMGMNQLPFNPNCHYCQEPGHRIANCPHVERHQREKLIIRVAGMLRLPNGNSIITMPGKTMRETVEMAVKVTPGTVPASKVPTGNSFYHEQDTEYEVFSQMDGPNLDAQIIRNLAELQQQYGTEALERVVNCITQETNHQNFH